MVDVNVHLEQVQYTANDVVRGEAVVSTPSVLTLNLIVVKLECVATTVIVVSSGNTSTMNSRYTEKHKLFYQTCTVFPPPEVLRVATPGVQFTLAPGTYRYPFTFALCEGNEFEKPIKPGFLQRSDRHLQCLLPPSLEKWQVGALSNATASIEYFAKAVVKRSGLLLNKRSYAPFLYLPRDPPVNRVYAAFRDTHRFQKRATRFEKGTAPEPVAPPVRRGFFHRTEKPKVPQPPLCTVDVALEVRFHYKTAINVHAPASFSLIITTPHPPSRFKVADGTSSGLGMIYFDDLEITILVMTRVHAKGVSRTGTRTLQVVKGRQLGIPFDLANAVPSVGGSTYEWEVPRELYANAFQPLNGLVPDFSICNMERWHSIKIEAGLKASKNESVSMFRLLATHRFEIESPIEISSGIPHPMAVPMAAIGSFPLPTVPVEGHLSAPTDQLPAYIASE